MAAESASASRACGLAGCFFFTNGSMVLRAQAYGISGCKPVRNHLPRAGFFLQRHAKEHAMAKSGISIGDDTPTGEPQNGPRGPYIDDESDDVTAPARKVRTRPGRASA